MVYVHRTLKRIISRAAALPPARLNDQDAFLLIKSLATLRYRGPEVSQIAQTATARLTANHQAYHIDLIVEWVTHLVTLQQRRHPLVMRVLLPRFVEVAPSTSPKTVQRALFTLTKLWAASDSHHTHHHVGGAKEDPFRAVADRLVRIAIQQLLSLTTSQQQDLALLKALASALPISSFRRKAMSVTMSEFLDKNHPLHAEIGSLSLLDWILLHLLGPHDNNDALLAAPEATLFAHCTNVVARSTGNDTFQLLCFTVCFTAVPKESQMSPTTQRLVQRFWDSLNIESSVPGGYASFLFQQLPNCCAAQSPDANSVDCVQRYLGPLVRKDSTLIKALNSYDLAKIASGMAEARWGRLFDSLGEHSKKLELLELLCRALDRLVTDAAFFVQMVAQQPPQPSNSERRPRTVDTVLICSVIHATCALGAELSSVRVHSVSSHDFIPSIAKRIVNLFSSSVVQHLLPATEGDHEDGERQQQRRSPGGELFIPATWCLLDLSRLARLPGCYDLAFQSLLSDLCRKIGQRVVAVGAEPSDSSKEGLLQTREMVQSLYAVTLLRTPGPLLELSSRDAEISTLNRVQEWRTSSLDGGLTSIILEMFARKELSLDSLTLGDWPMFLSVLANAAEMDREPQGQLQQQQQPTRLVVDTLVGWLQGQGGLPVQFHDLTLESGLSCCGSLLALSSVRSESLMAAKVLFNAVMTKCVGGLSTNSGEQQHRANIPNVAVVATFFSRWSKATLYDSLSNGGATSHDAGVPLNDVFGFQHRDLVQLWNAVVYPSLLLPRGGPLTVRAALRVLESWVASRTKKNVRVLLVDHGVYSAQLHEQSRTVSANSTQVVPFPVETLLRYSLIDETLEVLGIVLPQLRRLQTYLARPRGASSATERAFFQSLARQQEQLVGLLVRQCIQTAFTSRDLLNNRTSCSPKQLTRLQLWLRCHEAEADSLLCLPNRSASLSLFVDTLHQFCGVLQQLVWHCSSGDDATEATNHSLHSHHPSEEVASDVSVSREGQRLEKTHHMDVQLLQFIVRSFADSALAVRTLDFFESSSASPNGMQSAEPEGFEVRRVKEDIRRLLDMLVVSNHVTALEVRSSIQKLSILF